MEEKTGSLTLDTAATAPVVHGRYEVERELGRGGMGIVYLVRDLQRDGRLLALKSVRSSELGGQDVTSLKREFLVLSTLRHPGLARVHDFGLDPRSSEFFFTSDFVNGLDLQHALAGIDIGSAGGLDVLLDVIVQILRTLAFIHSHGLVHGDLKPQNILVTGEGRRIAKLIDFGITAREHQYSSKRVLGTKSYIAPEAIVGSHLDRRTDLYSFGAVFYHLVVGEPPFGTSSNLRILKDHVELAPRPPSHRCLGLPPAFDEVILRLLAKKPTDRYQNSLEVVQAINESFGRNDPLETDASIEGYLQSAPMRDRAEALKVCHRGFCLSCGVADDEQEILTSQWAEEDEGLLSTDTLPKPRAHTILMRGEPGSGRERVLKQLRALTQTLGATVLEASGGSQFSDSAGSSASFARLLKSLGGCLDGDSGAQLIDRAFELTRGRAVHMLTVEEEDVVGELARRLLAATANRPVVLMAEDLGEADALLQGFFAALVRTLKEGAVSRPRVLIVFALPLRASDHKFPLLSFLECDNSRPDAVEVSLRRLDREAAQQLIDARLPSNDFADTFFDRIYETTDGNPRAIEDALHFLTREKHLRRTVSGWTFCGDPKAVALPDSARAQLEETLSALSREAVSLAVAFAFLGLSAPLELATKLARLDEGAAQVGIRELRRAGILEKDRHQGTLSPQSGSEEQRRSTIYSFVHSTARDLVYDRVSPEKRANVHNLAAMLCLREYGAEENCQYLAEQFRRANNREQGILYSMRAADMFIEERKLRLALEAYEGILELCHGERVQTESTVRYRMARVRFLLGDFGEAARLLSSVSEAVEAGKADLSAFELYVDLARVYGRLGLFGMADSWLARAEANRPAAKSPQSLHGEHQLRFCRAELAFFQGDLQETIAQARVVLEQADGIEDRAFVCQLHLLAGDSRFALDDQQSALLHCQDALRLVDSRSEPELVDLSLFCLAKYFKYSGKLDRALKQFKLCAHSRRRLELLDGRAETLMEIGAIELFLERPQGALRHLDRAWKAYSKTQNAIGLVKSLNLRAEALRQLGRFGQATRLLRASEERQRTLGTAHKSRWESWFVEGRLRLDQGKLREAQADLKRTLRALPQDPRSQLKVLDVRGQFEYQRGNFGEVLEISQQGVELARRLDNRMRSVAFLEIRALTYQRLGEFKEASRLQTTMLEVARSTGLTVREGRAYLLEAVCNVTQGNWNKADECLLRARDVFAAEESERDLAFLHFYSSDYHLRTAEFEQCFMELEEALYLAKKLNLFYLKPQLFTALGLFEAKVPEGDPAKAENYLSHAERLAREAGYDDVHWQAIYHLGCVLRRKGNHGLAARLFKEAATRRNRILKNVPSRHRARYLRFSAGADLAEITRAIAAESR